MVGQFLYLPGLELQKLSLAKSTNSPKGKFTSKKKKKKSFQLAEASSKGKMTLPRDILFSNFHLKEPLDVFLRKSLLGLYLTKVIQRKI